MSTLNLYANVLIVGMSRSGKSEAIKKLVPFYKTWRIIVISDVAQYNREYSHITDSAFTAPNQNTNELLEITEAGFDRLKQIVEEQKVYIKRGHKARRVLFLFDDAISEEMDFGFLGTLLSRNRHLQIKVIISTQAVQASIRPLGRYNIHLLLLGNISIESAKYMYPISGYREKKAFIDLYEKNKRPYHFIRFNCSDPTEPPRLINSRRVKRIDLVT